MNDFDANLIREFRSRPAFYDRNNPRFKDKVFTAREWQEISNKLGYDVSLLKDRMLQLRNRYNLEKRRIEQEREVNPGISIESPWPLFDHLHFLSEHIRARRSYKRMLISAPQQATRMDLHSPGSNSSSGEIGGDGGGNGPPHDIDENGMPQMNMHAGGDFPNGFMPVRVKMEHDDDIETNSNGFDQNSSTLNGNIPSIHLQAYQQQDQPHNNDQQDTDPDESESHSITDNGAFVTSQSATMMSDKQYGYAQHQQHQQQQQQPQQQQRRRHHHHHQHHKVEQPEQPQRRNSSAPPPLKIRRIDSLRASGVGNTWIPVQPQQQQKRHTRSSNSHSNSIGGVIPTHHSASNNNIHNHNNNAHLNSLRTAKYKSSSRKSPTPTTAAYTTPREQKYVAFGDFVASSLLDLPPVTAMQLIERFTTEVVKVLIENDVTTESEQHKMSVESASGNNGGGNNTTGATCNGVAAAVN